MLQLNQKRMHLSWIMSRFQQELEEVGDRIVFSAARRHVNCFNLVNKMVEDSDHDEFNLNATEFLLEEALPSQNCENTRSSILKSFELTSNSYIIPGFEKKQYLVKSYSRPNDYFVCVRDTGFTSWLTTAQNTIKRDFVVIPLGQHSM